MGFPMSSDVALRSVSNPLPSLKLLNDALGDPLGCDIKKAEKRGGQLLGGASPALSRSKVGPPFVYLLIFACRGSTGWSPPCGPAKEMT
jgi:hypothetical protein